MASEYEKLRLEKISANKEVLEELGLRDVVPPQIHPQAHPKRKAYAPPDQPVRKSKRIHNIEQKKRELEERKKKELEKQKRKKELEERKKKKLKEKKKKELEEKKRKRKRITKSQTKKPPARTKKSTSTIRKTTSTTKNSTKQSKKNLTPPESDPGTSSDSDTSIDLDISSDSDQDTDSNSQSDLSADSARFQNRVAPITIDTAKMFSPIRVKVKDEREYDEEWYTKSDLRYLGSCKQRYPFMNIAKVADIHGTVCHQCLQRTRDKKTSCSTCRSPNGLICGQCLQTRYGENILEVFLKGEDWKCPSCRGICNCNACREMKNLQPIGAVCMSTLGYPSVAHWIMQTHLRK